MAVVEPDLSEFEAEPRKCPFGRVLEQLSEQDRVNFTAALREDRISNNRILERLAARDVRMHKDSVARHRKGLCCCEQS